MIIKKKILISLLILVILPIKSKFRLSSEPYISGDTFRKYADHIFDETNQNLNPNSIKKGDIVFVGTQLDNNLEKFFFRYHPIIKNPYILLTHNGDPSCPGKFINYLNDTKLYAWFTQNIDFEHHKLIPIPIGLENRHIGRGHFEIVNDLISKKAHQKNKKHLLYMNIATHTNPKIRIPIFEFFKNKNFCYVIQARNSVKDYLVDISNSKFVLSPRGNGLDCHRTWEALYLDAIPVVKSSSLDKLYDNLPVLIVSDWNIITKEFLEKKYLEIIGKIYNMEKLNFNYWLKLIREYQLNCRTKGEK